MSNSFTSGLIEEGIITGNNFDKYHSRNLIVQHLMTGFRKNLLSLINHSECRNIHDIGCGEGYWVLELRKLGFETMGSDFATTIIDQARKNALSMKISENFFKVRSIYDLDSDDSAELLLCCEVLEHLKKPKDALKRIANLKFKYAIFSVPNEPIWRILNVIRGKYWSAWGNTPGHLNHWSQQEFISLINDHFEVVVQKNPFPWSMVLVKKR